jgi:antitoxin CptB
MNEVLRKKLLYRSKHRGCKEMDLIFTNFMHEYFDNLSDKEVEQFENFLNENELEIREWVIEEKNIPTEYKALVSKLKI